MKRYPNIGIDIVKYRRAGTADLAQRVLTAKELLEQKKLLTAKARTDYLYGRWAAKEAVAKALDLRNGPLQIEILTTARGRPYVAVPKGREVVVSISHEKPWAVAIAAVFK